jgi:hypothetical protein
VHDAGAPAVAVASQCDFGTVVVHDAGQVFAVVFV